jgi:hypothetical protein
MAKALKIMFEPVLTTDAEMEVMYCKMLNIVQIFFHVMDTFSFRCLRVKRYQSW